MSVLMEFNVFSIAGAVSKRKEVAKLLKSLKDKGIEFSLNPMGTIVECENMQKALEILNFATQNVDAQRFYVIAKFDCYNQRKDLLATRVEDTLREIENLDE
ncbi:hypothetical protein BBW65_03165 [Helicobacter enhydrae]|uniref:Thiamine-binding protein domain-containing protein n=1 Tax=Helicobacter enhydrae TaxID=222136 RepID=A0A1B1U586_9HELI|nr:thiamine-binding protein [Helicobacter enhydrae]ANV97862.1 hypothetical protein BBW65_03165 [Helicobacter enhydrae]